MDVDYIRQVPITKDRYTYTKSRTTNIFDDILNDDIPSIVKRSYRKALQDDIPIYTSPYTATSPYRSPLLDDDISFKARPNTDYVVNRSYNQYGPLPRWNDTLEVSTQFPEIRRERSPYTAPTIYSETHPTPSTYMPSYVPRSSLFLDRDTPNFDRYDYKPKPDRSKPYFLKPELPRFYPSQTKPEDASMRVSSRLNTSFPFRKYRSDFVPYAPYHNMYDSMKYCPNPDWVTMKPWGHRFRKARFVYVPEDKNSCMSMEIERVMREARMRELCKGIYSSSYGDDISSRVNLATDSLDSKSSCNSGLQARPKPKAAEAEIAPTQGEKERRKPMSLADKRKRNETLAVGLSRTELLKNDNESAISAPSKLITTPLPPKEETHVQKYPTPPRNPTPPPKDPTPPPKDPTPPAHKEPTPLPPKEPTAPPKEPTPPAPKEPTPPPKEPTPPPKVPTPPPKEPTPPPPKEPTPPPPKEPTPPPPKECTPPPKEPTPPPPKEPTPPPKEPTPPPKEPTPPPKEPTPPPTPPPQREPSPPPPTREPSPPAKETPPPPQDEEETFPQEETVEEQPTLIVEESNNVEDLANSPSAETSNETENAANDPSVDDQINGYMEDNFERTETGHYMVEEVDNGDGQIIRTEYIIEEIELAK